MKPADAISALRAYAEATRGDVVPADVVMVRARICKGCPLRTKTVGLGRVSQILGNLANKHRLPSELKDYACSVCGCSFQLLLASKEGHKDNEKQKARRLKGNPNCWVLKL